MEMKEMESHQWNSRHKMNGKGHRWNKWHYLSGEQQIMSDKWIIVKRSKCSSHVMSNVVILYARGVWSNTRMGVAKC